MWLHALDSYVVQEPSRRKGKPSYEGERDEGGGFLELREGRSGGGSIRYFVCCLEKSMCSKALYLDVANCYIEFFQLSTTPLV